MAIGGNGLGVNTGLSPGFRFGSLFSLVGWMILLAACGGGGGSGSSAPPPVFTVSGILQPTAGNAVDSDVNDTNAVSVDNSDFASAQSIANPSFLGGYVNVAGSGRGGNSLDAGDPDDFFQVTLNSGDTVRLSLPLGAVAAGADVEVHLYRASDQALVDSLIGVVRTGSLPVAAADTYFIQVHAVSGATIYKLIVGDEAALTAYASEDGLVLSSDYVPGQALVVWTEGVDGGAVARSLTMTGGSVSRSGRLQLMRFSGADRMHQARDQLHIGSRRPAARAMRRARAGDQDKLDTLAVIRALRRRPDVALAEPNYIRQPVFAPNDELYQQNLQWNLKLINMPQAWDLTTGMSDVIVAVIDTGVLPDHPDLQNQLVPGWDFITDVINANDNDGPDEDPTDPGGGGNTSGSFHGTIVAGIVAAEFNNGIGIAGVGGATRIMPVRVLGADGGVDSDIIAAIEFAAGRNNQVTKANITLPAARADIINLSLGGSQPSTAMDQAIKGARDEGIIVTAAAGNTGTVQPQYPAASPGVISVGAVDAIGQRTYYTTYGSSVDVAAPGGDPWVDVNNDSNPDGVLSTTGFGPAGSITHTYAFASGTSFAAPHIAGVAALMKAVRSGLTPPEMDAYLAGGFITTDIGDSGLGAGLVDAAKAVQAASVAASPTALSVSPNALRFDSATLTSDLQLSKLGPDTLSVISWNADASWLSVAHPATGDLGVYKVTVDRSNLSGGLYTGAVTFVTNVNTVVVPVQMEVLPDTSSDVGFQYVLLMNKALTQVIAQQPAVLQNGAYTFSLEGVTSGTYYLVAGTDLDNDGIVVEPGEAWGIYASGANPTAITVSQNDIGGLTFRTGFSTSPFADTISIQSAD